MLHRKTAEYVSLGHPDKVADYISDSILDEILIIDKNARVACEVLVSNNLIIIAGEVSSFAKINYKKVAKNAIKEIGYSNKTKGFIPNKVKVIVKMKPQSNDIAIGIDKLNGAGDQGIIFGFATNETKEYLPKSFVIAKNLISYLRKVMLEKKISYILPDAKAQITMSADEKYITDIVLSVNHLDVNIDTLRQELKEKVILKAIDNSLINKETKFYINQTGRFINGGPACDVGLTGRKIICDTYGGFAPHGGGAFSGKDPTKLDRSGAYIARYIAKNIVFKGYAKKCQVMLAYVIGYNKPVTFRIDTFNTGKIKDEELEKMVLEKLDLSPQAIIEKLNLKNPIYKKTCQEGHFFGNFPWEKLDLF